jgi:hypothetical protein
MVISLRVAVVSALVLATACVKPSATPSGVRAARTGDGTTTVAVRPRRNPNIISTEELQDPTIAGRDALSAIRQLRPAYFTSRGPLSFRNAAAGQLQITQDFGPLQPWAALGTIDTRSLIEVRYLNAVDAQSRFGINANGGPVVVLLTSKD